MKKYYAHSIEGDPDREHWQELEEHLTAVAEKASEFAEDFKSPDWAWNAGMLHDLGKMADEFQAYLMRENGLDDSEYDEAGKGRINHSSAGAAYTEEEYARGIGQILSYLIAGHHAGLPDYDACDGGMGALLKRLEDGKSQLERIRQDIENVELPQRSLAGLPKFVNPKNFHLWTRFLFSSLTDADFLDTESVLSPERTAERETTASIRDLKQKLDSHMNKLSSKCEDTPVNRVRNEILEACRAAAKEAPGLFSLTVPTGGGKTLSAMSFALDHAAFHGKKRVIYVIPFTSIIEQTAGLLSEIFGAENVVEHHSNLDPDKETMRTLLASENWDAPIIVTTNVQFFESLYSARTSRCRKLHNLVNSVVIVDEAQMIPPKWLEPCVHSIDELTHNYGVTMVLSTATQPALPELEPKEIIPEGLDLYGRLQRTEIRFPEKLDEPETWDHLAAKLREHDQILCIVNTRRDCYELHQLMPEGTICLSALMCGEHRSRIISDIKTRLKGGEPLRVISTQLVEAGVDIDFPVVYRALAGLDSVAQAAGRCNREGKLHEYGQVFVFASPRPAPIGLLRKGEDTTRELYHLTDFDPQSPQCYTRYFDCFYNRVNDRGEAFLKELRNDAPAVPFRKCGAAFKLIDDQHSRPVLVRFEKGTELIEKLRNEGPSRELMRKLQRYTVNISVRDAERMLDDGLLEEVRPIWAKETSPGFLAQCMKIYSEKIGLDIFREGMPIEDITGV